MIIRKSLRWKQIYEIEYDGIWYKIISSIKVYISTYGEVRKEYDNGYVKSTYGYGKRYKRITITCLDNNKHIKKEILIHRLVAYAFLPKRQYDTDVNHIDGNPRNNRVGNLEWVTHRENVRHALDTGLTPTIMTKELILLISKLLVDGYTDSEISKKIVNMGYYCTPSIVYRIRNKDNWKDITKDFKFPKNKPNHIIGQKIAKEILSLVNDGYSNKEIIDKLDLNHIFNKKSAINTYLYRIRHKYIWKSIY